jgi:hypothetical protein
VTTHSGERESLFHLPGYISERTRSAEEDGLTLDKQVHKQGLLSTWYGGSEAGFRTARLVRIPADFAFPLKVGGRKLFSLGVFCPAAPGAQLRCSIVKTAEDRYRLAIVNEVLPAAWRSLGNRVDVYKYTALNEGPNRGPATVYVGDFAPLAAAGIASSEAERDRVNGVGEQSVPVAMSQPLEDGRHRLVIYHEAEAQARAQDEERGRSSFRSPEQYQDWVLEVVAASISMIRRQLRVKTKRRYVYTVPVRTLRELEAHFARIRKTIVRSEIIIEKEDMRAEAQRAAQRHAALAAMRDADFQRFLGKVLSAPASNKKP